VASTFSSSSVASTFSSSVASSMDFSSHTEVSIVSKPLLPDISNVVHPYDIFTYRARLANKEDIHFLIKNVFVPDISYVFPKVSGRSFRREWLKDHPWLRYSQHLNGGFCLPCVLFGQELPSKSSRVKKLFSEPLTPLPNAKSIMKCHTSAKNGLHQEAIIIFNEINSAGW
jgi:hypothetical protein